MASSKGSDNGKVKSLESWIWDAACSIRGARDAAKYKDFILPLIFTKRLCDVFDDELDRTAEKVGSRKKAFQQMCVSGTAVHCCSIFLGAWEVSSWPRTVCIRPTFPFSHDLIHRLTFPQYDLVSNHPSNRPTVPLFYRPTKGSTDTPVKHTTDHPTI